MKKKTIKYDHQLTPYAIRLVRDVEAREARKERHEKLTQAALGSDWKPKGKAA